MKNKLLILVFSVVLTACGSSPDKGWKTDDLEQIPMFIDQNVAYVSTDDGKLFERGCYYIGGLYHDGLALVFEGDGCRYFIDKKGVRLNEENYQDATIFDGGVAWAVKPGSAPFAVDKKGGVLFEFPQAERVMAFHNGLAVWNDAKGNVGVVDKKGNVVFGPCWEESGPMFVNGLLPVRDGTTGLWGAIDTKGEIAIECRFEKLCISDFEDYEYFDSNYVQALCEGRIPVRHGGKWGIVDHTGRFVINPQFDELLLDGKNYLFRKGDAWGWCDSKGRYKIDPRFDRALPFGSEKLAAVRSEEGKWGYIDRDGLWVIQPDYRIAGAFSPAGVAPVCDYRSRDWGLIDESGLWMVNPQFEFICDIGLGNRFLVEDSSHHIGLIDSKGNYVIEPVYDDAAIALRNNLQGLGVSWSVVSDYVDVAGIAAMIDRKLMSLKADTAGGLMKAYGLKESNFPKNGGSVTIYRRNDTPDVNFKIETAVVNAWTRVSDGWFGYNYVFRPEVAVGSYTMTVRFDGRASRFVEEILDALKQSHTYDAEKQLFELPGRDVFAFPVANGGIVFQVTLK